MRTLKRPYLGMLELKKNISRMKRFYNHEFYTAIMDENLGHIEDLTKKHGSNFLIPVQETAHGDLWKVKKKNCHFKKRLSFQKNVNFLLKRLLQN